MRRAKRLSTQTITCPDCGLVLRAIGGTTGFKCVYDIKVWRRACTRVYLGDAAWVSSSVMARIRCLGP